MLKINTFINNLSKFQKLTCLIIILSFVLLLLFGIPTLARFKNRSFDSTSNVWNGSIANSYKSGTGTEADPYIISNGSELAHFANELQSNDYDNTYFALSNNIVLNDGIFSYDSTNGISYIKDNQTYYIDNYSNKYYNNIEKEGTETGLVNIFNTLNNFKGTLDGKSYRIYGLYITDENKEQLALFTNLKGNIHDLYVENSIIYGGNISAGIASNTENSSLKNILYNGYVVGKDNTSEKIMNITPAVSQINLQSEETTTNIDLQANLPLVGNQIISTSITGNYTINGAEEEGVIIKINGTIVTDGSFNIDSGSNILDSISVVTSTTSSNEVSLDISNLSYNIVYKYAVSGGIVGISKNSTISNCINKGDIYSKSISSGLVGTTNTSLSITNSYNNGNIYGSNIGGGLIGVIENSTDNINISNSYNNNNITSPELGGLISVIKNNAGIISINNVFDTSSSYSIDTINNTTVNVNNAYNTNSNQVKSGTINGTFTQTSISNLQNKDYIMNTLSFNEFVSFNELENNNNSVWIYEKDSLPIIFIDDLNKPVGSIHSSIYSWNNLSYDLNKTNFISNITFSINESDQLNPMKEIYYYINKSDTPLTKTQLDNLTSWISYDGIKQISKEGYYIIYAKMVDFDDNVTYLNTDVLVLDLPGTVVDIKLDDNTWNSFDSTPNYTYIDRPKDITIDIDEEISDITSIKYYLSNEVLTITALESLNESDWINYLDKISITEYGKYIIYVKVVDDFNYTNYINTNYIIYDGYQNNSITIGKNPSSYIDIEPNITSNSIITLNYTYENSSDELQDYTHNLVSNILLPTDSKIILFDNVRNKVYEYKITTSDNIYPFSLFKEVGTPNKPYIERTYYSNGIVKENFTIILDLSDTSINTDYNDTMLYLELHKPDGTNVRPTVYNTIKKFNIYSNNDAGLYLTTDYNGNEIIYNSDSTTDININSGISYKTINDKNIIDTTYENKKIGLSIKMVDSDGNIVDKKYLKNIIFKIGDNTYFPSNDNIVRINLQSGIANVTKTLSIITSDANNSLKKGTYYFKIANYASDDGYYYNELGSNIISVPVNVSDKNINIDYSFNVLMDDSNRIVKKTNENVNISFNILQKGSLENPNIRVSLYKKDQLTAYDQTYSIVDLAYYVTNNLNKYQNNVYYVSANPKEYNGTDDSYNNFNLNLITSNFENTGYKFIFSLYDGDKKIGTIEKYFIVR
jgi:hypothetical protein